MKPPQLFYHATDISKPEDIIPFLGKGERHWKAGRSAYELAYSWVAASGIPDPVRSLLEQAEEFRDATLIEAFFEKETDLGTRGRPSQTDLLAVCRCAGGLGVIGVEGKVDEPFGPLVSEWRDGSEGKERRLQHLLEQLEISENDAAHLRYQLLHRTVAALIEAQRYRADTAMMLVHSFSTDHACFEDFQKFAEIIGAPVSKPDALSSPVERMGMALRLGWVVDQIRANG